MDIMCRCRWVCHFVYTCVDVCVCVCVRACVSVCVRACVCICLSVCLSASWPVFIHWRTSTDIYNNECRKAKYRTVIFKRKCSIDAEGNEKKWLEERKTFFFPFICFATHTLVRDLNLHTSSRDTRDTIFFLLFFCMIRVLHGCRV